MVEIDAETTQWCADVLTIWNRRRDSNLPLYVTREFVSATAQGIAHRKLDIELRMSLEATKPVRAA